MPIHGYYISRLVWSCFTHCVSFENYLFISSSFFSVYCQFALTQMLYFTMFWKVPNMQISAKQLCSTVLFVFLYIWLTRSSPHLLSPFILHLFPLPRLLSLWRPFWIVNCCLPSPHFYLHDNFSRASCEGNETVCLKYITAWQHFRVVSNHGDQCLLDLNWKKYGHL